MASNIASTPRPDVAILGAGTQGRRLAYMWSSLGNDVHIIDGQQSQLEDAVQAVSDFRASRDSPDSKHGKIFTYTPDKLSDAVRNSWLIVECVPERLPLKRQVLSQLDEAAPEDIIIASNSSSYACSEIVQGQDLKNSRRVLSAHTYWPPETPAIEIMGHEGTDPSYIDLMMKQCAAHGFDPYHVRGQSMGYLYNRIWAAIKREALLAASEGAGTPEEIDAIFKGVLKTPKGPFEQMDVVGLDVVLDIEQHYADARGDIPQGPRDFLKQYLDKGHLGVKSGKGFYNYGKSHRL